MFRIVISAGACLLLSQGRPSDIAFRIHAIDPGASETAALADLDRDGHLDIVSGEFWYHAPDWTRHKFREVGFSSNYIDSFSVMPIDVDGDGYPDIADVSWFARKIAWWKNPGRAANAGLWQETEISGGGNVEFAMLADIDNDGNAREIVAQQNGTPQAWFEVQGGAFVKHIVSDQTYGHGIGAGDVNRDGRTDILTPRGWLEAPANPRAEGQWTFHADWETTNVTPQPQPRVTELGFMHVLDVNGDGRNDIVTAAGHDYGVFWFENAASGPWPRRTIDTAWSQGHASTLVDLNGDGRLDLVTGKRFMAHNGTDPGEKEPLGLYWYEVRTRGAQVEWIRHLIDYGGRLGGGMQIPVVDVDGDGDLDLVCAGKSGLFFVENLTKTASPARGK